MSKIFSAANKLNDYNVIIGDIDIIKECIVSVEISYKNTSPKILAKVILDDLYDMNAQLEWNEEQCTIKYTDVFDEDVEHEFVILHISEVLDNKKDKLLIIEMQDTFSYVLEHSYLSRSFTGNIISAIEEYITELELDDYETDFSSVTGEDEGFVIPKHINNLESFLIELRKKGFVFYQNKEKVIIKSLDDLSPSSLPENGDEYINETDNQLYKNRIIEIKNTFNNRLNVPPISRAIAYDITTKTIEEADPDEMDGYTLNSDTTNPQDTDGIRDVYQIHLDFNQLTSEMKEAYLSRGIIQIITNGYAKNDLNQIYELKLRGNKSSADLQAKGNQIINGKYISTGIVDKIITDTMIQKITLYRADLTQWN